MNEMTYELAEKGREMLYNLDYSRKEIYEILNVDPKAMQKALRYDSFLHKERQTTFCEGGADGPLQDRLVIERAQCKNLEMWNTLLYSKKLGQLDGEQPCQ